MPSTSIKIGSISRYVKARADDDVSVRASEKDSENVLLKAVEQSSRGTGNPASVFRTISLGLRTLITFQNFLGLVVSRCGSVSEKK